MKESPIFVKMHDLVAWLIPLTIKFPREQRFVAAAALQRVTFACYEALIRAGSASDAALAQAQLDDAVTYLNLMRMYLRLSHTMACITTKQYEYASERFTEVGRLLQAWLTTIRQKPGADASRQAHG